MICKQVFIFLLSILSLYGHVMAQTARPLTVGDKVPGIAFTASRNGQALRAHLSDYKGRLVILDFFATWCGPCVAALPRMHALQERFGGRIQVIAVTMEPAEVVRSFFARRHAAGDIADIVMVTDDSVFSKHFIYHIVPHEVWIDGRGEVKAITSENYVNAENIGRILNGEAVDWPVKEKEQRHFDHKNTPLFQLSDAAANVSHLACRYSGLSHVVNGVGNGGFHKEDSVGNVLRYDQYNQPIAGLYELAYDFHPFYAGISKQLVLYVRDTAAFLFDNHRPGSYYDEWLAANSYCYEALHPLNATPAAIRRRLREDLDFFLDLDSKIVTRKMPVLILKRIDTTKQKKEEAISRKEFVRQADGNYVYRQKDERLLFGLVQTLNSDSWLKHIPLVIDESGYGEKTTMELFIGEDAEDIDAWRKALSGYGLDLLPEVREVTMLILSDDKYYGP